MTEDILGDLKRMTPRQRAQATYMMDICRRIEWDIHNAIDHRGFIPDEWHEIARATPEKRKIKVTMRIDGDVVKFFRSMGEGHLTRMADVLQVFMHARLAGIVRGAETLNHFRYREKVHDGPRPAFGEVARLFGEEWEDAPPPPGFEPKLSPGERLQEMQRRRKEFEKARDEAQSGRNPKR